MMPNQIEGVPLNGGIDAEINLRMMRDGTSGRFSDGNEGWFDPEALKTTLEAVATEAGVERLYFTHFVEPIVEEASPSEAASSTTKPDSSPSARPAPSTRPATPTWPRAQACRCAAATIEGEHQPLAFRFMLGGLDLDTLTAFLQDTGRTGYTPANRAGDVGPGHLGDGRG